jgi:Na+/H+ antiporter NhaD/arsenite permease-like protein
MLIMTEESFTTKTSKWSDSIEKIIQNIGEQSKGFKWMNSEAAKYASFRHSLMTYLIIFIGPLSGVLSSVQK